MKIPGNETVTSLGNSYNMQLKRPLATFNFNIVKNEIEVNFVFPCNSVALPLKKIEMFLCHVFTFCGLYNRICYLILLTAIVLYIVTFIPNP